MFFGTQTVSFLCVYFNLLMQLIYVSVADFNLQREEIEESKLDLSNCVFQKQEEDSCCSAGLLFCMDMKKKLDSLPSSPSPSLTTKQSTTATTTTATGQPQYLQTPCSSSPQQTTIRRILTYHYNLYYSSHMAVSSSSFSSPARISHFNNHTFIILVAFLLFFSSSSTTTIIIHGVAAASTAPSSHSAAGNQTFRSDKEMQKLKKMNNYLNKINKPAVKTIQVLITY